LMTMGLGMRPTPRFVARPERAFVASCLGSVFL
jgi:hypothetical protein